jgi:hypothetical protein
MKQDQIRPNQGPSEHRISAEHLKLALFARKHSLSGFNPGLLNTRWAAFSNGWDSLGNGCPRRPPSPDLQRQLKHPPLFLPFRHGITEALVRRTRMSYGLPEIKRTWGLGYKALLAELNHRVGD